MCSKAVHYFILLMGVLLMSPFGLGQNRTPNQSLNGSPNQNHNSSQNASSTDTAASDAKRAAAKSKLRRVEAENESTSSAVNALQKRDSQIQKLGPRHYKAKDYSTGTESGGGGTTVFFQGHRVLLDFLRLGTDVQDRAEYEVQDKNGNRERRNAFVIDQHTLQADGENVELALSAIQGESSSQFLNSDPVKLAQALLADWVDDDFLSQTTGFLQQALDEPVHWLLNSDDSQAPPYPTADISDFKVQQVSEPRLAAYYSNNLLSTTQIEDRFYDISIQTNEWNRLGLLSQTGLLIHEGLRHLQYALPRSAGVEINDLQLQKATAVLVFCKPSPTLNNYISALLTGYNFGPKIDDSNFHQFIKDNCKLKINSTGQIDRHGAYL